MGWAGVGAVLKPHQQLQQSICVTGFIFPRSVLRECVWSRGGWGSLGRTREVNACAESPCQRSLRVVEPCPRGLALS